MKRIILTFVLFAGLFCSGRAQQIVNVSTAPFNPTCNDTMMVMVWIYWFCNVHVQDSVTTSVTGSTIEVNQYWQSDSCIGSIFLSQDTVVIGQVPSGNYTVVVNLYDSLMLVNTDSFTTVSVGTCCPAQASFTTTDTVVCEGGTLNFTNTSVGGISYWWKLDGVTFSTGTNASRVFNTPGYFEIRLVTTDGSCDDSTSYIIGVKVPPSVSPFTTVHLNKDIQFYDQSPDVWNPDYLWDFGDLSTDTVRHPLHVYADTGTYRVCLTITNPCGTDSVCGDVVVTCPLPVAKFGFTVSGFTVTFTDSSTTANSWYWDFGDGRFSAMRNPAITYVSKGLYNVCLIVTNFCGSDTICKAVDLMSGIGEISPGTIWLMPYPQPVTGESWIDFGEPEGNCNSIILTDILGREINVLGYLEFRGGTLVVMKKDLPAGTYFIYIQAVNHYRGIVQVN